MALAMGPAESRMDSRCLASAPLTMPLPRLGLGPGTAQGEEGQGTWVASHSLWAVAPLGPSLWPPAPGLAPHGLAASSPNAETSGPHLQLDSLPSGSLCFALLLLLPESPPNCSTGRFNFPLLRAPLPQPLSCNMELTWASTKSLN